MNKNTKILLAFLFVAAGVGILTNLHSQPTNIGNNDDLSGRYRLIPVSEGNYSTIYIMDTQTGRNWRQVVDSQNKMLVFVSNTYRNIDGELSKVPNEKATAVVVRGDRDQGAHGATDGEFGKGPDAGANGSGAKDRRIQNLEQKFDGDLKRLFPDTKPPVNTNSP